MPQERDERIPVVDLFAGPGGLGEGFAAVGMLKGKPRFRLALSIEQDDRAHKTLELRSLLRQFQPGDAPEEYYRFLRGEIERGELFSKFHLEAERARNEARKATLGQVDPSQVDGWVRRAIGDGSNSWVLLGGPPCQAYSVAGRSRNRGNSGYHPEDDERHFLYEEYLRIIARHWPPVFVMENVKGLLSATVSDDHMVQRILQELADPDNAGGAENGHRYRIYSLAKPSAFGDDDFEPADLVVRAEEYGVPQARHRVILLGIRDDVEVQPSSLRVKSPVAASVVLEGLPEVRSGLSREEDRPERWLEVLRDVRSADWTGEGGTLFAEQLSGRIDAVLDAIEAPGEDRGNEFISHPGVGIAFAPPEWFIDERLAGVCNHSTRDHMVDDLHRYLYAACYAEVFHESPRLQDFPRELLPNHRSVKRGHFKDRFRVQLRNRPATTITSHISKDGHYYIHYDPSQCRSLTVREAARLQTFPDNYFFCGPRTSQYIQVGNAVPPYLAMQIGEVILGVMQKAGLAE